MLTTLIPATSGTALIHGHDVVKEADAVRRLIGVIPQAMTSDLELSVEENLLIYAKLYGVPRDRRRRLMAELIEAVELTKWSDKPVKNLSGGMRRRVEIARGLVHEPRDLLPRRADDRSRSRIARRRLGNAAADQAERDLTVLITTHYMDEADKLCDRIAIVDHGELMALDSPMKLKASIPGKNVLEVSFPTTPAGWADRLKQLPEVESVSGHDNIFRVATRNGPATTMALLEAAARAEQSPVALAVGPEHDARRCVRALHRARAARRAAGGRRRRTAHS